MAGKLPVERTITEAYRYGFARLLSVLGTVWLPYLAFLAIVIGLVFLLAPDLPRMIAEQDFDIPAVMGLSRLALLVFVFGFIVSAMVSVGLQRIALGLHPRPVYVFFSLGAPVWRMAAALFLAGLVVLFVALLSAAVAAALWFAAGGLGAAVWLIRVVIVLAACAFLIYVALRLLFFLPAVVVSEETIGIERAWILGGNNFWRILIVTVAVIFPIAIVFHILSWALLGSSVAWPGGHMAPRDLVRTLFMQFGALGIFGLLFQIVERVILLAVLNSAVGKAYLAVIAKDAVPPGAAAIAA
jgi:hypothetical protein